MIISHAKLRLFLLSASSPLTRRSKLEEVTSHTLGGHGGQGGNTAHCLPTVETRCGQELLVSTFNTSHRHTAHLEGAGGITGMCKASKL
uniref:Uncharacterized protein n=1 Tax=Timema tahoe TaxID=61484 RepID=A0A7R9FKY0_9NEOP|nr:unnamed protein product [Timema tahoe]